MLDVFRRRKGGLKWVLWLVILVLGAGMLLFFVQTPGGMGVGLINQNVAIVAGNSITMNQYRRVYNQIYESYRQMYPLDQGGAELLKLLGIGDQALDRLVDEYAIAYEAQSMGIEATREELAEYITTLPSFQEDGRFIGTERYIQILLANKSSSIGIRRRTEARNRSDQVAESGHGRDPGDIGRSATRVSGPQSGNQDSLCCHGPKGTRSGDRQPGRSENLFRATEGKLPNS